MRSLTFNTDSLSPKGNLVKSVTDLSPQVSPEYTLGETSTHKIYLANSAGYDSSSGSASLTVKVGVGTPGGTIVVLQSSFSPITANVANGLPSGGTYTLSSGGYTTSALAYNATSATLQAALEALNSIGVGNVVVGGLWPNFTIEFQNNLGSFPLPLISAASSLTPASAINIAYAQTGSPAQDCIQTLSFNTYTSQNVGWTGTIAFNTGALVALFTVGGLTLPAINSVMEFSYVDGSGNVTVFGSFGVRIYNNVVATSSPSGQISGTVSNIASIGNATDTVTITGLALGAAPRFGVVTVSKPAGGYDIFGTIVQGSITTDGFIVNLSGMTDSANYKLGYILFF